MVKRGATATLTLPLSIGTLGGFADRLHSWLGPEVVIHSLLETPGASGWKGRADQSCFPLRAIDSPTVCLGQKPGNLGFETGIFL